MSYVDVEDFDDYDAVGVEHCEHCGEVFLPEALRFEEGDPFCEQCWDEMFIKEERNR